MLGALTGRKSRRQVFRLASIPSEDGFLEELALDSQGRDELRNLLASSGHGMGLDNLCDGPFRLKRRFRRRTRFSDGSFPVFYSALDPATVEAEVCHWLPYYIGRPRTRRTAHYLRFSCTFEGLEKDLRPKIAEWPDIVHKSDYTFCNQLGAEAKRSGLDGLVTPSARCDGTNLPIFARAAISKPNWHDLVAITYDPDTDAVAIASQPVSPDPLPST